MGVVFLLSLALGPNIFILFVKLFVYSLIGNDAQIYTLPGPKTKQKKQSHCLDLNRQMLIMDNYYACYMFGSSA